MGGGIDPGDLCFCPRVVGVVEMRREFSSGDNTLSSLGAAGPRRCPERQLSPRAASTSLSQSATTQLGWSFHTLRGGIDPGRISSHPRIRNSSIYLQFQQPGDENADPPGRYRPHCVETPTPLGHCRLAEAHGASARRELPLGATPRSRRTRGG